MKRMLISIFCIAVLVVVAVLPSIGFALPMPANPFPEYPYSLNEYMMTLMGINYQWLFFNMLSNPISSLYYVAMTFALIGGLVILILPRFQKLMVAVPYLFLVFIVLVGPYNSDLFFRQIAVDADERVTPGENVTMSRHRACNSTAGPVSSGCTARGGLPIMEDVIGQTDVQNKAVMGGAPPMVGYVPQLAVLHFTTKIQSALIDTFFTGSSTLGPMTDTTKIQSQSVAAEADEISLKDPVLHYEKELFTRVCKEFQDYPFARTQKEFLNPPAFWSNPIDTIRATFGSGSEVVKRAGWESFTLEDVKNLQGIYYQFAKKNLATPVLPPRAEGLIGYLSKITPNELSMNTAFPDFIADYLAGWADDIGDEAFTGAGAHNQTPLRSNPVKYQFYDDTNNTPDKRVDYLDKLRPLWYAAHLAVLAEKVTFPLVLYREPQGVTARGLDSPGTIGASRLGKEWVTTDVKVAGNVITNKQLQAKLKPYEDPLYAAMWQLPVAIRIPKSIGTADYNIDVNGYNTTNDYSYRVTNCAEFIAALNDRYRDKVQREKDVPVALTADTPLHAGAITLTAAGTNYLIPGNSQYKGTHNEIANAVDAYVADYRYYNGNQNPPEHLVRVFVSDYFMNKNKDAEQAPMDRIGKGGAFSDLSGGVAGIAAWLGGWVMEILSWFIGVAAHLFYRFATALAYYGLSISLMITPLLYMMGLIIPGWSLQIILAPIAAVLYFKTVSISFILIDFFVKNLKTAEVLYEGGTIEHALFTFIAAAAYMGAFGFAGFLLFGLGSAGGLVQNLGGKMDAAASQGATQTSSMVARPLKAAAFGTASVIGGKATATVQGAIGSKMDGEGRKWFNKGGAPLDKNGNELASAFAVGNKEGGDVWDALGESVKKIPGIGGLVSESLNAGRQAKSTGKMMDAMNAAAKLEGKEPPSYNEMREDMRDRAFTAQNVQQLNAVGQRNAAGILATNELASTPSEESTALGQMFHENMQANANYDTNVKDADGASFPIDGPKSAFGSRTTRANYAKAKGLSQDDAGQDINHRLRGALYDAGQDGVKVFSPYKEFNENTGEMEVGYQINQEFIARSKANKDGHYDTIMDIIESADGKAGVAQGGDADGNMRLRTGEYVPPGGKGKAASASTGGGDDPNNGGGGGSGGGNTGTRSDGNGSGGDGTGGSGGSSDPREKELVPNSSDANIDGRELGRDIARGMKDEMGNSTSQFGNQYQKEGMFYMTSKQKKSVDDIDKPDPDDGKPKKKYPY